MRGRCDTAADVPGRSEFWFETLRNLGLAAYGGSDVGEVVATASQVTSGDYDGWHDAWLSTAKRPEADAHASHPVSARDGLLRASTYYRAAEFFLHGDPRDPRIDHAYQRGVACFRDAIAHLPGITPVEIPYEDAKLHGYFYRAAGVPPGHKERLVKAPYPAWSMIGVDGLASPELLVEIRATAAYPDGPAR